MARRVCTVAHHHDSTDQHALNRTTTHRHILTWPGGVHSYTSPRQHKPTCPHPHSHASAHPHMARGVCTVAHHHDSTNQHALNRTSTHRHSLTWPPGCAQRHITTFAQARKPTLAQPRIGTSSHGPREGAQLHITATTQTNMLTSARPRFGTSSQGLRGVHSGTSPRSHRPTCPHKHNHASAQLHSWSCAQRHIATYTPVNMTT